jgi:hypothetical protein
MALGIALATLVGLAITLAWFSPRGFFPAWWRALGNAGPVPSGGADGRSMAPTFAMVLGALVTQAFLLAVVIDLVAERSAAGAASVGLGALVGLVAGVGIAATSSLGHRLFTGQGLRVWAIEVGGDVASLVGMGAVVGLLG